MRKIVTSYIKPDIDGISSMYAYAELLRKMGYKAKKISHRDILHD